MIEKFNYIFQYLKSEQIIVDKSEFEFQIQSHQNFPSLLAISDTLHFLKVENKALKVEFEDVEILPQNFIALLNNNYQKELFFIQKRQNNSFFVDNKLYTIKELQSKWEGIVFIIKKANDENLKSSNHLLPKSLFFFSFILLFGFIFLFGENLKTQLFFIFPILGILISIFAFKDLFGAKSDIISKFCNISEYSDCSTIINSKKWRLFKIINFSDLSIIFFVFNIIGLSLFLIFGKANDFFGLLKIGLLLAMPFTFISIFYQKFIEKKWCPICLAISFLLWLELTFLTFNQDYGFSRSIKSIFLFILSLVFVSISWKIFKSLLQKNNELRDFKIKATRFQRNYEIFKNTLITKKKVIFPNTPIIFGNKESKTVITIITSPFCGHCRKAHEILNEILKNHKKNLKIQLLIKGDVDVLEEHYRTFFYTLIGLYQQKGEKYFILSLNEWYENKDIHKWLKKYSLNIENKMGIDAIYLNHKNWCKKEGFNYTPAIFINGYEYPEQYDRENLIFFINEILEDSLIE